MIDRSKLYKRLTPTHWVYLRISDTLMEINSKLLTEDYGHEFLLLFNELTILIETAEKMLTCEVTNARNS